MEFLFINDLRNGNILLPTHPLALFPTPPQKIIREICVPVLAQIPFKTISPVICIFIFLFDKNILTQTYLQISCILTSLISDDAINKQVFSPF